MEKKVHQTWKTNEINGVTAAWTSSVKAAFPDYEYKLWTDEDNHQLVYNYYPEFYQHYSQNLNAIEKTDFARYLYIHHCGGVYIDLDVKMNFAINFGDQDVFLCDQTNEANIDKWPILMDPFCVAGKKGYPFFYDVCSTIVRGTIYRLLAGHCQNRLYYSLYTTGPFLLTKFYLIHKNKYNIGIIKNQITTSRYEHDGRPKDQFAGVHMQTNTWMRPEDRMK